MGKKKEEFYVLCFWPCKNKVAREYSERQGEKKESLMTTSTQCHSLDLVLLYSRAEGKPENLKGLMVLIHAVNFP